MQNPLIYEEIRCNIFEKHIRHIRNICHNRRKQVKAGNPAVWLYGNGNRPHSLYLYILPCPIPARSCILPCHHLLSVRRWMFGLLEGYGIACRGY